MFQSRGFFRDRIRPNTKKTKNFSFIASEKVLKLPINKNSNFHHLLAQKVENLLFIHELISSLTNKDKVSFFLLIIFQSYPNIEFIKEDFSLKQIKNFLKPSFLIIRVYLLKNKLNFN